MTAREQYPELVGIIRRLYEELRAHDADYHHRTDPRLLMDVREFLVAVGELPVPAAPREDTAGIPENARPDLGSKGDEQ